MTCCSRLVTEKQLKKLTDLRVEELLELMEKLTDNQRWLIQKFFTKVYLKPMW